MLISLIISFDSYDVCALCGLSAGLEPGDAGTVSWTVDFKCYLLERLSLG